MDIAKKPLLRLILLTASISLATQAAAHEGHKRDMTDAEMAQMKAGQQPSAPASDAVPVDSAKDNAPHMAHEAMPASPAPASMESLRAQNRASSPTDFLGRLHPFAVHFPIALLLTAALAELLFMMRPALRLGATIRLLVAVGAAGAAVSAALGWFAAGWRLTDRSEMLTMHRWLGTAIALTALIAWVVAARSDHRRGRLRLLLATLALALLGQGYLGGEMVFGPNHLGIF